MKIVSCAALIGAAAALAASTAPAAAQTTSAVFQLQNGAVPQLDKVQYAWGGRQYCWYGNGWHGPGWYWCGYAMRRGFGWGGVEGWHGWRRGGVVVVHRERGWRGHDRGWHGGHDRGRRDHDGWRH